MEKLLDDNHMKSKHQGKGNKLRVKRNYDRNSLLLHSARLHKLSKQLFQLKIIKSNNRTTAQFFSTTCYRRLKIPKRRRQFIKQFNIIRVAILFLLITFGYLWYWKHGTLFTRDDINNNLNEEEEDYLPKQIDYRSNSRNDLYLDNSKKLKQIDEEEKETNNRKDDRIDNRIDGLVSERQHLLLDQTKNDRSSMKLDFNTQQQQQKQQQWYSDQNLIIKQANPEIMKISEPINKEIKSKQQIIQTNNSDHSYIISKIVTSTPGTGSSTTIQLPALHIILNPQFKNYSFLDKKRKKNKKKNEATNSLVVSKSNQSSSVSSIFPVEQRKNSKSILEKQLAWYELVGITMFNLLGSSNSLTQKNENSKFSNKKFQNHTANGTKIQSNVETTLSKPISSSILSTSSHSFSFMLDAKHQKGVHLKNNDTHLTTITTTITPSLLEKDAKATAVEKSNQTLTSTKNLKRRLPQSIIIGVRKSGTRAVLEYLTLNDHIKKADNELHFFDNDDRYSLGLDYYRNQMPLTADGQISIEKSPAYFVTSSVPARIKAMNESIKLILIVRDPVTRLISDYTQLTHNKLLKLDDLMRTSGGRGLNRQYHSQQQQQQQLLQKHSNYLFKFPIDKQKKNEQKNSHLEKQAAIYKLKSSSSSSPTNEHHEFTSVDGTISIGGRDEKNNLKKKETISTRQDSFGDSTKTTTAAKTTIDYWNKKIATEPDYLKAEQPNDDEELIEQKEDDTFALLPIVKRQIRNVDSTMNSNWSMLSNEQTSKRKRIAKSIDFKDSNRNSKIIDSIRASKLKTDKKNRKRKGEIERMKQRQSSKMEKSKINTKMKKKKIQISGEKEGKKSKINRISRQAVASIDNRNIDEEEEEVENYKIYKKLNLDDEDIELDDEYSSVVEKKSKEQSTHQEEKEQQQQQVNSHLKQPTIATIKDQVMTKNQNDDDDNDEEEEDDYHNLNWNIPKFEELVIRNGEVNTNYKPVKTSIYSLYITNWLRVFRRDQIHIVDGDRLIKEPHVELNKIETFLGLPIQINRNQFVFNSKKKFYCARMYHTLNNNNNVNSSIGGWRRKIKLTATINKTHLNKTNGRHSSIRCLNSSKGRKHPQVDKQVISQLRQFYAPFNRHFEHLVDMRFNWPEI